MAHILLVEPDRLLAETYRELFTGRGHTVTMCAGAQSAVFAADEIKPDLVILELQLIGHSGIEFLYEFRSYPDWRDVPVLVLTGVPAGEFTGSWELFRRELNIHGYLYKPLTSLSSLLGSVDELLPQTTLS